MPGKTTRAWGTQHSQTLAKLTKTGAGVKVERNKILFFMLREGHGQATMAEAKALVDEGVSVAALPLPVVPPETTS